MRRWFRTGCSRRGGRNGQRTGGPSEQEQGVLLSHGMGEWENGFPSARCPLSRLRFNPPNKRDCLYRCSPRIGSSQIIPPGRQFTPTEPCCSFMRIIPSTIRICCTEYSPRPRLNRTMPNQSNMAIYIVFGPGNVPRSRAQEHPTKPTTSTCYSDHDRSLHPSLIFRQHLPVQV